MFANANIGFWIKKIVNISRIVNNRLKMIFFAKEAQSSKLKLKAQS